MELPGAWQGRIGLLKTTNILKGLEHPALSYYESAIRNYIFAKFLPNAVCVPSVKNSG